MPVGCFESTAEPSAMLVLASYCQEVGYWLKGWRVASDTLPVAEEKARTCGQNA